MENWGHPDPLSRQISLGGHCLWIVENMDVEGWGSGSFVWLLPPLLLGLVILDTLGYSSKTAEVWAELQMGCRGCPRLEWRGAKGKSSGAKAGL